MSSVVSKKHSNPSEPEKNAEDLEESNHQPSRAVTSHLQLKPAHSAGTLDKEVALRRIRRRKRVNKIKKAWADDAFAAP
ncbi:unnamed protein product [Coffea canephora]|uniref:Uncharacterized protein n=1 Tax=Coffea canephora TaxID=49390 RepID=A0A068UG91_COFCA|nr:unnamed protein product [Coffea canephora]